MDKLESSYSRHITQIEVVTNRHDCDYQLDMDGQVTCAQCGAMDDDR